MPYLHKEGAQRIGGHTLGFVVSRSTKQRPMDNMERKQGEGAYLFGIVLKLNRTFSPLCSSVMRSVPSSNSLVDLGPPVPPPREYSTSKTSRGPGFWTGLVATVCQSFVPIPLLLLTWYRYNRFESEG